MSTLQYDAGVLDALHRCDVSAEHLAHVSPRWKPLAEHLAGLPIESRGAAFGSMLTGLPKDEADALETAMDRHDSDGPPPIPSEGEATVEVVDSWGPLRIGEPPPVEPFPLDVLPQPARDLVTEAALAIGCPCDFLAVPVLAVAGGAIGRSVSLRLKPGYFASSTLFVANVGPPSDGKSQRSKPCPIRFGGSMRHSRLNMNRRWNDGTPNVIGSVPTVRRGSRTTRRQGRDGSTWTT